MVIIKCSGRSQTRAGKRLLHFARGPGPGKKGDGTADQSGLGMVD